MKIIWEVEDGYTGAARPQTTEVSDDELAECDTDEEREALIQEYVAEDFAQRITWGIRSRGD